MKALEITTRNPDRAYAILGEYAGLYGDNGGDPDGSALLPSEPDTIPADLEDTVRVAGLGRLVNIRVANDAGMLGYLGKSHLVPALTSDDPDEVEQTIELLKADADDRCSAGWSHYGSYATPGSLWVFIVDEEP